MLSESTYQNALDIMKTRLNRLTSDTSLDMDALLPRLRGAEATLRENGIVLEDNASDLMLLVDYATWRYQNRDKPGAMPDWLRHLRRDRFLHQKRGETDDS